MLKLDLLKQGGVWDKLRLTHPDGQTAIIEINSTNPKKIRLSIDAPREIDIQRIENEVIQTTSGSLEASILCGAIGDAWGYTLEHKRLPLIHRLYGEQGLQEPQFKDGKLVVTDDTQMSLFTLEAVLDVTDSDSIDRIAERIRLAYLDWYQTQKDDPLEEATTGKIWRMPEMNGMRAPGQTCMKAMAGGGAGTLEMRINDSKGCGTCMRTAAIGLIAKWNPETTFEIGMRASVITHGHDTGILSGGAMAAICRYLIDGEELLDAILKTRDILISHDNHGETLNCIDLALTLADSDDQPLQAIKKIGLGWIAEEALGIGVYSALKADNYKDCIRMAINHDGDSDSTGSIAGQLWGAEHGMDGIPDGWEAAIDVLPVIRKLI